ncbi:kinase-like domain-containing protein [Rhizophagus irregularis DAOM 181602=DAOM 197198]|nr:kinase-like domain-containing protein [Rhizophagus irregularis DAOM 181602=DAOM 197198]
MWGFTSGNPPFMYEECDAISICEGKRPKIMENTPKCYIDLMKKCWDEDPSNRPTVIMLENIISQWIYCIDEYYRVNKDENYNVMPKFDDQQLENDMMEFVKANKANLEQEPVNTTPITQSHSQEYSISRELTTEYFVQESDDEYSHI